MNGRVSQKGLRLDLGLDSACQHVVVIDVPIDYFSKFPERASDIKIAKAFKYVVVVTEPGGAACLRKTITSPHLPRSIHPKPATLPSYFTHRQVLQVLQLAQLVARLLSARHHLHNEG